MRARIYLAVMFRAFSKMTLPKSIAVATRKLRSSARALGTTLTAAVLRARIILTQGTITKQAISILRGSPWGIPSAMPVACPSKPPGSVLRALIPPVNLQ